MKRYVIYSEEMGIFLGECLGLGFWSKLDCVGQDCAATLSTLEQAEQFLSDTMILIKTELKIVPVDTKENYATMDECERAGLPSWDPEYQIKD